MKLYRRTPPALDPVERGLPIVTAGIAILFYGVAALIILIFIFSQFTTQQALSQEHHRYHATYQNWVNKSGQGCCNDQDCRDLAARDERQTTDGFIEVRIEGQWCPILWKHYLQTGNSPDWATSHVCVAKRGTGLDGRPVAAGPCERLLCYQPQPKG